ncbi:MAG: diacylglycerol kinase, partial [Pseudomonadota bacterium]
RQTRASSDRMDVTRVHAAPDGDTMFEAPSEPHWHLQSSEVVPKGPNDSAATTYEVWLRA